MQIDTNNSHHRHFVQLHFTQLNTTRVCHSKDQSQSMLWHSFHLMSGEWEKINNLRQGESMTTQEKLHQLHESVWENKHRPWLNAFLITVQTTAFILFQTSKRMSKLKREETHRLLRREVIMFVGNEIEKNFVQFLLLLSNSNHSAKKQPFLLFISYMECQGMV